MPIEGSGSCGNGEVRSSQITRDLLRHTERCKLDLVGTAEKSKGSRVKQ